MKQILLALIPVALAILGYGARAIRRKRKRARLSIEAASAKREVPAGLPYVKIHVTVVIGNQEGRDPARHWRFEVDAPVLDEIRIGFAGKGYEKWGDRYIVTWQARDETDVLAGRRNLAPFEIEIPAHLTLVGHFRLTATGAKGQAGEFRVDPGAVTVHFHPD